MNLFVNLQVFGEILLVAVAVFIAMHVSFIKKRLRRSTRDMEDKPQYSLDPYEEKERIQPEAEYENEPGREAAVEEAEERRVREDELRHGHAHEPSIPYIPPEVKDFSSAESAADGKKSKAKKTVS